MNNHWHRFCLIFFLCLLIILPTKTNPSNAINHQMAAVGKPPVSSRPVKITSQTSTLTLIFKKNVAIDNVYLITPEGIKQSIAEKNNGILATSNYEVVQIKDPIPGEWVLTGPQEQLNEILTLTDLTLDTNLNNGVYFNGELFSLRGHFKEAEQFLDSDMAVENIKMKLELKNNQQTFSYIIPYAQKGVFENTFILNLPKGNYTARVDAEGTYLSRTRHYAIEIQDPPFIQAINIEQDALMLELHKPDLIKPWTVKINVFYKDTLVNIPFHPVKHGWIASLYSLCKKRAFSEENVLLEIHAQATNGRNLLFKLLLNGKVCSPNYQPKPATQPVKPKTNQAPSAINSLLKNQKLFIYLILLLILIIAGILFIVLRHRRKRKSAQINDEKSKL